MSTKLPKLNLKVTGISIYALIDTGSSLYVVPESVIQKIRPRPILQEYKTNVFAFGHTNPLPIKGKYSCTVETNMLCY